MPSRSLSLGIGEREQIDVGHRLEQAEPEDQRARPAGESSTPGRERGVQPGQRVVGTRSWNGVPSVNVPWVSA